MGFVTNFINSIKSPSPGGIAVAGAKTAIQAGVSDINSEFSKNSGYKEVVGNRIKRNTDFKYLRSKNIIETDKKMISDQQVKDSMKLVKNQQSQIKELSQTVSNISNDLYGS